jgi:hypothetical protein
MVKMGWNYGLTELGPLTGPLYHLQIIRVSMEPHRNDTDWENWRTQRKTYPSAILSITNHELAAQGMNSALWSENLLISVWVMSWSHANDDGD